MSGFNFLLNVSKNDVLHSHFHNAGRTIPRIVLRWFSSIPEHFMLLIDDIHTTWIHGFWISNKFHPLCSWYPNAYAKLDNRDCAAQRHSLTPSLFDIFSKNLSHTWCKAATKFKFYGNDVWTLHQHIEFSRHFYIVINNAGKVDRNCELFGILVLFGLRQLRQPAWPRLPIFWFSRKQK